MTRLALLGSPIDRALSPVLHRAAYTAMGPHAGRWEVREGGPVQLWQRIEAILDAYDAGQPGPETSTLLIDDHEQRVRHPQLPELLLRQS